MHTYILRRTFQALAVCLVISFISFMLLFLSGDPAVTLLPPDADIRTIETFRQQMGLDRPILVQYWDFLSGVVLQGDFGQSFVARVPALHVVAAHLGATLQLALAALIFVTLFSVPIGIVAAIRPGSAIDNFATFIGLVGQAMPLYWLGIMLIIIFGVQLQWLPTSGNRNVTSIILPAITLGWYLLPLNMRLVRSGMIEVLNQDYIRTARAKGLPARWVLGKHALRNATIPLVTVMGLQFGALLGGAVVTETVFAWPGLGRLVVSSIQDGDYPVVQAIVIIFAIIVVAANLIADIVAALLDPRIRFD